MHLVTEQYRPWSCPFPSTMLSRLNRVSSRLPRKFVLRHAISRPITTSHARHTSLSSQLNVIQSPLAHAGPRPALTHRIAELSRDDSDLPVVVAGWLVAKRQANAQLYFFTLRDSRGDVQLVVNTKDSGQDAAQQLMELPLESVVQVQGFVQERKLKSGQDAANGPDAVEVGVRQVVVLNAAEASLPFYPNHHEMVRSKALKLLACANARLVRPTTSYELNTATWTCEERLSPRIYKSGAR